MNSLSYKIGLGYLTIIVFNILLAVYAINYINNMSGPLDKILKENYRNISTAENMKLAFTQQELTQLSMIESSVDSANLTGFKRHGDDFLNWRRQAYTNISLPAELTILDSLENAYQKYLDASDSLQKLIQLNTPYIDCKAYHYNRIIPLATTVSKLCSRLKEVNEQAIFEADNKARSISYKAIIFISAFAVIIIFVSIMAGIYFTKRIIKPLKMTTESVRKIQRGHINQKVAIVTNDEIAELGIEFNSMTDRINRYVRDVSGLKELDRLKSDFMATISHEFKTPLTSINMVIDILQKEIKGNLNTEQKDLLAAAKEDVVRLNSFARDLLELSRLESDRVKLDYKQIQTQDLLQSLLQSHKMALTEKNMEVTTNVSSNAQKFVADRKQISRVLSNLMDNAIRFCDQNGIIKISVIKQQKDIIFSIRDNGKGIDPDYLDLIFEKFMQAENQNSINVGLGLAIAKEIITLHNGKIWAENNREKGSTFYFSLPLETKK